MTRTKFLQRVERLAQALARSTGPDAEAFQDAVVDLLASEGYSKAPDDGKHFKNWLRHHVGFMRKRAAAAGAELQDQVPASEVSLDQAWVGVELTDEEAGRRRARLERGDQEEYWIRQLAERIRHEPCYPDGRAISHLNGEPGSVYCSLHWAHTLILRDVPPGWWGPAPLCCRQRGDVAAAIIEPWVPAPPPENVPLPWWIHHELANEAPLVKGVKDTDHKSWASASPIRTRTRTGAAAWRQLALALGWTSRKLETIEEQELLYERRIARATAVLQDLPPARIVTIHPKSSTMRHTQQARARGKIIAYDTSLEGYSPGDREQISLTVGRQDDGDRLEETRDRKRYLERQPPRSRDERTLAVRRAGCQTCGGLAFDRLEGHRPVVGCLNGHRFYGPDLRENV